MQATSVSEGKPLWNIVRSKPFQPRQLGASPNGRVVWATDAENAHLVFLEARTGKRLWSLPILTYNTSMQAAFVFSPDSRMDAIANETEIVAFDVLSGQRLWSRVIHNLRASLTMQLSDEGNTLYTLETDGRVLRWCLR